jgi:hypothetical protein
MRKLLVIGAILTVMIAACDTKTPSGPGTVTITGPSPFTTTTTTSTTTTSVTTTLSTTTSTVPFTLTRTYIGLGVVVPTTPNVLSISLRQIGGTPANPVFTVLGFYTTPSGAGGAVQGTLNGTLDDGAFAGTLTSVTPECTAEREYAGRVNAQQLQWTGGLKLKDCKNNPLGFNSFTMLVTTAPPPITPPVTVTTTIPLTCLYALSAGGASFDINGGSTLVQLSTGPTCSWTVQRFVDWLNVQPTSGTGTASLAVTVMPNPGAPRSTTIVIGGQPFVVNQGSVAFTTTSTTTTTIPF